MLELHLKSVAVIQDVIGSIVTENSILSDNWMSESSWIKYEREKRANHSEEINRAAFFFLPFGRGGVTDFDLTCSFLSKV